MNLIEKPVFIFRKPYVICILHLDRQEGVAYSGVAKCNPRDKWDVKVGVELALVRAIKDAVEHIEDRVAGSNLWRRQGLDDVHEANAVCDEITRRYVA